MTLLTDLATACEAVLGFLAGLLAFLGLLWLTGQPWWAAPVVVRACGWVV